MKKFDRETAIFVAYDDEEPIDPSVPEKSLLLAVLLGAMNDLQKGKKVRAEALEFFRDPDEDYLFSFRSICDYLGVDPLVILRFAGLESGDGEKPVSQESPKESS